MGLVVLGGLAGIPPAMSDVTIIVLSCALLLASSVALFALIARDNKPKTDLLQDRMRSKVILTHKNGDAFRGVLWEWDARIVVLRNADALGVGDRGTDIGVDGELVLPADEVAYMQVL